MNRIWIALCCMGCLVITSATAQPKKGNPVFVDAKGVLRWTKDKKEAAFFGVNYTVPFAYGYRSHKALGIDPEKAIDADVAHMARLGFDAFRVHVWDTEISDSAGNLLNNEHLRLFDYLLFKLKEKGIKILITPLAFWGNGYPEPDRNTGSFSSKYNKQKVLVTPEAIAAQEVYLRQFFRHINPYTKTTYGNDPDVIAMEINNEPHHSGPKAAVTDYINRMAAAVRATGWTKPVFYNISESPTYADAVVKAAVDGHSFQWYPTGLVANRTLEGNFLPNVDLYRIPFPDTIPAFANRARMVYEFDAGDVIGSYMYPAMARSFRQAGFQWATQFAYDPLYTAHANTEYQTHYVNLAYTPSKALSLMIAGKAFHRLPRLRNYGAFPADTLFDVFRVSYLQDLSEMNSREEFYYSNTTGTQPVRPEALRHIAGVGSSALVQYDGTGAYFLDKTSEGSWVLEIMPDVFQVADPFGKASPQRTVRQLHAQQRALTLHLPGLQEGFAVRNDNGQALLVQNNGFVAMPGKYTITKAGGNAPATVSKGQGITYPLARADSLILTHQPIAFMEAGKALLQVQASGSDSVRAELRHSGAGWKTITLAKGPGFSFSTLLPVEMQTPGLLEYRFLVAYKGKDCQVFPGGVCGDPYAWDAPATQTFETMLLPRQSSWMLFDAATHRKALSHFTPDWRTNKISYQTGNEPPYLWQVLETAMAGAGPQVGWQLPLPNGAVQWSTEGSSKIRIRVKGDTTAQVTIALIDQSTSGYLTTFALQQNKEWYELPLSAFKQGAYLLLPRPYPGFQPLFYEPKGTSKFNPATLDKIQFWVTATAPGARGRQVFLQSIFLE